MDFPLFGNSLWVLHCPFVSFNSVLKHFSEPSFSILFPRHSTKDYVEVDDPKLRELSAITICAWVKFVNNTNGAIISYAVPGSSNEIDIWCYTKEVIFSIKNQWER